MLWNFALWGIILTSLRISLEACQTCNGFISWSPLLWMFQKAYSRGMTRLWVRAPVNASSQLDSSYFFKMFWAGSVLLSFLSESGSVNALESRPWFSLVEQLDARSVSCPKSFGTIQFRRFIHENSWVPCLIWGSEEDKGRWGRIGSWLT